MSNILLCRPSYPSSRSNVYKIPVGLCKLSTYHKSINDKVYYVDGTVLDGSIPYDKIDICYVTTIFSYWSSISIETINFYKKHCNNAKIIAGGIYASIVPEHLKTNSMVDEVVVGVIPEVEKFYPDYSILSTDVPEINNTQIIWASRGCRRFCDHCYVHVIEPEVYFKDVDDIKKEILHNKNRKNVLFYDNSLMQHPDLERLLGMLQIWHKNSGFVYTMTQGLDGRMLKEWEDKGVNISQLIHDAGFIDLRFSYDWKYQKESVYYCVEHLEKAGYKKNSMQVFVVINSREPPSLIEKRYWEIYSELGTQIHSDRFRPGDVFYDNYHMGGSDYFIDEKHGWTNSNIRGILRFMSDLNYATRMKCLYVESGDMQKASILNKGKSSHKISEFL